MEVTGNALGAMAVNYAVHYGSATFYNTFCVPHSLKEVLFTLVSTASPICSFALGVTHLTQQNYAGIIAGTLALSAGSALKFLGSTQSS